MTVFVDTSALYSVVTMADERHDVAQSIFIRLVVNEEPLVTHNYVEVETVSIIHARHGIAPLPQLQEILDIVECLWIDDELHETALRQLLTTGRRGPSLVDRVSFEVMERSGISKAFAFDEHFTAAGFHTLEA